MIIGIDKGHAIKGSVGAVGILNEVIENRAVGNKLISMLKEYGHTVVDCSVDEANDSNTQLAGIVKKANAQKLDLFVSIHFNSFADASANGTETFTTSTSSAKAVAKRINDEIVASCGFRNRGLKEASYYVLRNTTAPALLVEVCFITNQGDCNKYNADKVAKAMFKGITGTDYVPKTTTAPSGTKFRVVAGWYANRTNAVNQQDKLKAKGFDSFLVAHNHNGTDGFRVVCGTYANRTNADNQKAKLEKAGFNAFLVTI